MSRTSYQMLNALHIGYIHLHVLHAVIHTAAGRQRGSVRAIADVAQGKTTSPRKSVCIRYVIYVVYFTECIKKKKCVIDWIFTECIGRTVRCK